MQLGNKARTVDKILSPVRGWETFLVPFPGLHLLLRCAPEKGCPGLASYAPYGSCRSCVGSCSPTVAKLGWGTLNCEWVKIARTWGARPAHDQGEEQDNHLSTH